MADRPSDVFFTRTHEWFRVGDDGIVTVGITDFAIEHLGDLVFVDLPDVGQDVEVGKPCCEVESVKAVGEVYAPATGEVTAINEDLADDQGPLADDPFGTGWLFQVKPSDGAPQGMDLAEYEVQLKSEPTA